MSAILDPQVDMASFFNSVRKAHCMNILQTPPSSPEPNDVVSRHIAPKLHLSKVLQRGDIGSSPAHARGNTKGPAAATPLQGYGSSRKRSSKLPSSRAVTEMREPFRLMLPDSPALTDESAHSGEERKQRLRRINASHLDLRALARAQALPIPSNGNTPLLPSPMFKSNEERLEAESYFAYPKRRDTPPPETESEFSNDDDAPYEVHRIISGYCTRERWSLLLDEVRQSKQASQLRHAKSPWTQHRESGELTSPQQQQQPVTPPSQIIKKRERACSAESNWLASNKSHEERYRKFKQRCCGMVQHPTRAGAPNMQENGEGEVMLATVLIGPGKPKLVQIQRPPSASSGRRASQTEPFKPDAETENHNYSPRTLLQTPPPHTTQETSAFSPYDTPCYTQHEQQRTYGAMTPFLESTESVLQTLRPVPLSITPRRRNLRPRRIDSAIFIPERSTSKKGIAATKTPVVAGVRNCFHLHPNDPAESAVSIATFASYTSSTVWPVPPPSTLSSSHTTSPSTSTTQTTSPVSPPPNCHDNHHYTSNYLRHPQPHPRPQRSSLQSRKLSSALDAITAAIDAFHVSYSSTSPTPNSIPISISSPSSSSSPLTLNHPLTRQLRHTSVPAHEYLTVLHRVFIPPSSPTAPNAPAVTDHFLQLLDSLAAWALVDSWLSDAVVDDSEGGRLEGEGAVVVVGEGREEGACGSSCSCRSAGEGRCRASYASRRNGTPGRTSRRARRLLATSDGGAGVDVFENTGDALASRAAVVKVSVGIVGRRLLEAVGAASAFAGGSGNGSVEMWRAVGVIVSMVDRRGGEGDDRGDEEDDERGDGEQEGLERDVGEGRGEWL